VYSWFSGKTDPPSSTLPHANTCENEKVAHILWMEQVISGFAKWRMAYVEALILKLENKNTIVF
jgi:hypothetical protein